MGTTSTNFCITHAANWRKISCGAYRSVNSKSISTQSVNTTNIVKSSEWKALHAVVKTERALRGLSTTVAVTDFNVGKTVLASTISKLRDHIEEMSGANSSSASGGIRRTTTNYISARYNQTRRDGGTLTGGVDNSGRFTGDYTSTGVWVSDHWNTTSNYKNANVLQDSASLVPYGTKGTVIDDLHFNEMYKKLAAIVKDCICNTDCGAHSICSCYSSHCSSYYY